MRNYNLGFTPNIVVLGIFIIISIFNIATTSADGICENVDCVKGKCVEGGSFLGMGFDCVCDLGWKKMQLGPISFPACNFPNCTLDFDCGTQAPSPPPSANFSDPCSLVWCGNGKCHVNGTGHYCQCNEGSTQYLNMSALPCLDKCVFGPDCKGVALSPQPTIPPPPSPGHDGACEHVDCGKGKCVEGGGFLGLGFQCVCDPGWTQMQLGPVTFPTCNVPNCTLNLGCGSPSLPSAPAPFNTSDPCSLVLCANGKCEVKGTQHYCQCNEGSENLFDIPTLPCLNKCVFGADCKGVELGGHQLNLVPPPPPGDGSSGDPKDPNSSRSFRALTVLLLFTIFPVLI
ncbi:uncharacterized protein LOC107806950 isoform X2 [Nicotiana tabacum]|uniref:Uncharacterized protein LOC107806950 isoform X2 n=1 Tax=Nicotiana tabacum TaxID=4097 RepID=A0AC58UMY3_TOBAC